MFDDYTYLRQYSKKYFKEIFSDQGLYTIGEFDHGRYLWDEKLHWLQKLFSKVYTRKLFKGVNSLEHYQHSVAIVLTKASQLRSEE